MKKTISIITTLLLILSCDTPDYELDNNVDTYIQDLKSPAIFFHPHDYKVNMNDTAFVQIYALEIDSVAGMHLQVHYDWGSVELDTVLSDDFFINSDDTLLFYEDNDGILDLHLFYLPNETNSVNGTIALCVLVFETKSLGESELRFSAANSIVVNPRNEKIQISQYGEGIIDVQ